MGDISRCRGKAQVKKMAQGGRVRKNSGPKNPPNPEIKNAPRAGPISGGTRRMAMGGMVGPAVSPVQTPMAPPMKIGGGPGGGGGGVMPMQQRMKRGGKVGC